MGLSFGYNQVEDLSGMMSSNELIHLLIDTVAFNGNLLLNVGPKGDGTIPESQKQRLLDIGRWLGIYGNAIYNTTPYSKQKEELSTGEFVYYTQNTSSVFLIIDAPKPGDSELRIPALPCKIASMKNPGNIIAGFTEKANHWLISLHQIPEDSTPIVFSFSK